LTTLSWEVVLSLLLPLVVLLLLLLADILPTPASVIATIALLAALAHAVRLYLWQPWRTLATPLVWVLHAAYGWIVVYLVLRALAAHGRSMMLRDVARHAGMPAAELAGYLNDSKGNDSKGGDGRGSRGG